MACPRTLLLAGLGLLLVLGGCSSSPKEELLTSADAKCGELSARFTGDLAYRSGGGADVFGKRATLLEDLQGEVRGMAAPESDQRELDRWLAKLGELAESTRQLDTYFQERASDTVLLLQASAVDSEVDEVGRAAKRFGFITCAQVDDWKIAQD